MATKKKSFSHFFEPALALGSRGLERSHDEAFFYSAPYTSMCRSKQRDELWDGRAHIRRQSSVFA